MKVTMLISKHELKIPTTVCTKLKTRNVLNTETRARSQKRFKQVTWWSFRLLTSRCGAASVVNPTVAAASPINPPCIETNKNAKNMSPLNQKNEIEKYFTSLFFKGKKNLAVVGLGRVGEFVGQQIDDRRYLLVIPGGRQRLHNSLDLRK